MNDNGKESISEALERLALALGENGAVPVAELVRALERAAERLRTRGVSTELPHDLVTQAEASRAVGVSRQAVNQWVRNGVVRSFVRGGGSGRYAPEVSLSEVAIAANRRTREVPFSAPLRRELLEFLALLAQGPADGLARSIRECIEDDRFPGEAHEQIRVLREFVLASMGDGERQQHEFTAAGVKLLADMPPRFEVDPHEPFGRLLDSLGLLVHSADGTDGFDSPVTAILGLLGAATIGAQYPGDDADTGRAIAAAAEKVWGAEWTARLYDVAFHVGELRSSPLTRYTASLTYLDNNRFLRQAQASGVSVTYARGPGPFLPQRFYGAHILSDILAGVREESAVWKWSPDRGPRARPAELPSTDNPFRIFHYEYGLLDPSIYGIRRYCFSAADARDELLTQLDRIPAAQRSAYLECVIATLARTLRQPYVELVSIPRREDFDWWKDHIIRSSEREILIGLRDERARRTAHGLLVQTSLLPKVVEAADSDGPLRDRLRIYVKNLEFDVVDVRYHDDVRREISRVVKAGGRRLGENEARSLAESEVRALLD